jgi:hypothetical protein
MPRLAVYAAGLRPLHVVVAYLLVRLEAVVEAAMLRRPTGSLPRRCGRRLQRAPRSRGSEAGRRRAGRRQALSRRPRALPACQRLPGRVGVALHLQPLQFPAPLLPPQLVALVHVVLVDEHLHPLLDLTAAITPTTMNYCCCYAHYPRTQQQHKSKREEEEEEEEEEEGESCSGEPHLYIERATR